VVVDLHLVDGRIMRGVLHTATPFHGKKFELALKGVTALNAAGVVVEDPSIEVASTALFAFTDIKTLTVPKKNVADKEGIFMFLSKFLSFTLITLELMMYILYEKLRNKTLKRTARLVAVPICENWRDAICNLWGTLGWRLRPQLALRLAHAVVSVNGTSLKQTSGYTTSRTPMTRIFTPKNLTRVTLPRNS
jgi:hypothetical protein